MPLLRLIIKAIWLGDPINLIYHLDFLSRIPTIPELKRYQAEIVIKEEPEEEEHIESDADVEDE